LQVVKITELGSTKKHSTDWSISQLIDERQLIYQFVDELVNTSIY